MLATYNRAVALERLLHNLEGQSVPRGDWEIMVAVDGSVDDTETVLRAGDVVVQRGTNHRWENRTTDTARMAFILVDGAFTPELLAALGNDVLGGLLHDPMHAPGAGA